VCIEYRIDINRNLIHTDHDIHHQKSKPNISTFDDMPLSLAV